MRSEMRMIYLDSDDQARQTGVGAVFDTNAETWAAFLSAKRLDIGHVRADFLLDYYNRNGDLSDTIGLSRASFEQITQERAKSEIEYRAIDERYCREQMAA